MLQLLVSGFLTAILLLRFLSLVNIWTTVEKMTTKKGINGYISLLKDIIFFQQRKISAMFGSKKYGNNVWYFKYDIQNLF